MKNLTWYKKEAKKWFQRWIRMRDADDNGWCRCCTCGKKKKWNEGDGGHFIRASYLSTCFVEENVHFQCKGCNSFKGGAWEKYIEFMQQRYGQEVIDELLAKKNELRKYKKEDYQEIIEKYREGCASFELTKNLGD